MMAISKSSGGYEIGAGTDHGSTFQINQVRKGVGGSGGNAYEFPSIATDLVEKLFEQQYLSGILYIKLPYHVFPSHVFIPPSPRVTPIKSLYNMSAIKSNFLPVHIDNLSTL